MNKLEVRTAGSYGRAAFASSGVQGRSQKSTVQVEPQVCDMPCVGRSSHASFLPQAPCCCCSGSSQGQGYMDPGSPGPPANFHMPLCSSQVYSVPRLSVLCTTLCKSQPAGIHRNQISHLSQPAPWQRKPTRVTPTNREKQHPRGGKLPLPSDSVLTDLSSHPPSSYS